MAHVEDYRLPTAIRRSSHRGTGRSVEAPRAQRPHRRRRGPLRTQRGLCRADGVRRRRTRHPRREAQSPRRRGALGHPIGASGGILTTTMLYAMERADHHRGIVEMTSAVAARLR
ncbi:hypothetical protein C8039_18135 [Halogeometricum sp. wsp3]|nr:hypothetical protein C8039_18135 [Halogeometricum sp. wsp3]